MEPDGVHSRIAANLHAWTFLAASIHICANIYVNMPMRISTLSPRVRIVLVALLVVVVAQITHRLLRLAVLRMAVRWTGSVSSLRPAAAAKPVVHLGNARCQRVAA